MIRRSGPPLDTYFPNLVVRLLSVNHGPGPAVRVRVTRRCASAACVAPTFHAIVASTHSQTDAIFNFTSSLQCRNSL
ncbi:unnamed protein product [Danaus chrysippus]|uniref:(African queen) hypothetical protein n=1 Tax=Danaus chrysippus TaxID=151541 RepID=A0A8J2RJZ5_9NEOP|nr:unnamed protein product [Danaus chrysippus]